jgi:nucleotide-binding universal stress UspA family protein
MGAYSHYRWREKVFGGVTESVLQEMHAPVLMAH